MTAGTPYERFVNASVYAMRRLVFRFVLSKDCPRLCVRHAQESLEILQSEFCIECLYEETKSTD